MSGASRELGIWPEATGWELRVQNGEWGCDGAEWKTGGMARKVSLKY